MRLNSLREMPGRKDGFATLAGIVLANLRPGDQFEVNGCAFEVLQMEDNRIAKVLITKRNQFENLSKN